MCKKILSATLLSAMFLTTQLSALAFDYSDNDIEHLQNSENSKINLVKVNPCGNVIQKENYIVVNFAQNFNSKYYKMGDYVQFSFDSDLRTQEGTLLIPCNSSLIARITCIETPKWFSRNAKVFMEFTHILLPDGQNIPVAVQLASKKKYLQEGAKETAGKIAAYTLAIGGTGAGLGSAIGVAAGNTITGLIIGGSVGGGVGLVTGIVSPGLHYKAKKGESVVLELEDNLKLPN
ncbi:MAG: hypothetical protein IJW73_04790 [Candidatus Gastranaerophilales bacterium]|nr:hypothetical protein [Candidatus Gastranaerophilales bacterium]